VFPYLFLFLARRKTLGVASFDQAGALVKVPRAGQKWRGKVKALTVVLTGSF
jgi:hypothetical protein